ncbi:hypothetical protein [Wolbachia endosymbiont of Tettigetta isshikii]|uniref:hypothetical protein n=1 Tax=Wolbachia endosymbiont of Tettigetta isshikii TaxID=3239093 RepID=UPI00397F9E82
MVRDFPKNSDSSIYKARIREADLASQAKLQEIQGAADELARQAIIDKLRQAEVEHEKLKLKLEQEASGRVEDILSRVESAVENENNFTSGIDGFLVKLFKFFNFMDSELGVETDPQVYRVIKRCEEEEKEAWVATVIKFLRDKFNKLIKAIFSRDLSFQQKIDQEIERLFKRLFDDNLFQEEEVAILGRLEALRNLKLKLQIFTVCAVIAMFAEIFSVELTASVETTKEEGKEKSSAKEKEAAEEVHENLEIKVDPKEKPTVPVSLFDFSSGVAKPITLSKPELHLLPNPLKDILPPVPKDDMNKGSSGGLKPEVERKQENENKKPTQPAQEPKGAAPPPAPKQPAKNTMGQKQRKDSQECSNHKKMNKNPNAYKESVTDCGFNFSSMDTWKGADYEHKQSSVNNTQENPRTKFTDVSGKPVRGKNSKAPRIF